jgi:UDP-N-acetylglucosamine--N-acetylmuramyl-(pentapeptide) pyrophosphoryl-undecaprenol N-acetylglucosamine transferase
VSNADSRAVAGGKRPVVLIMAGGTGGHVFPALALARLLRAASHEVVWLGTRRGLEARIVPAENIAIEWLSMSGLRGKGASTMLLAPFKLLQSIWQALGVMRRRKPALVVGFGGFVTGPGGVAAWLTRRPLVIHEQNAIAGYSNRMLAHLARRILSAFPRAFPAGVDAQVVGNPVRAEIAMQPPPAARFAQREGAPRVLVVGGSLGASRLNSVVPFALAQLARSGMTLHVRHQAGERGIDAARAAYAEAKVSGEVTPFIDDMARAYADADLVICRAGALTVSELAAVGVASVLVPFPAAVDDHQTVNAQFLVREGAAVLIADRDLTADKLAATLRELCAGRGKLLAMAERARQVARPRAAEDLAAVCLEQLEVAA